mmetsp:Transcript_27191/g.63562  ORF Transcript_27191/g.63562 Transcript_27191/m.63562 type:complete len:209 (+) Transcript_27191:773-1399(+)
MLFTPSLPWPYGIVGWSGRAATRATHSSTDTSKKTHTHVREDLPVFADHMPLNATSSSSRRSSAPTLHLSTSTVGALLEPPTALESAVSKGLRPPPSSSWLTRTSQPAWAASRAVAKVLLPEPGIPTSKTSSGSRKSPRGAVVALGLLAAAPWPATTRRLCVAAGGASGAEAGTGAATGSSASTVRICARDCMSSSTFGSEGARMSGS